MSKGPVESFADLSEALASWPANWPLELGKIPDAQRRLVDALTIAAEDSASVGGPDIAALLRHVIRSEEELTGTRIPLRLPLDSRLPAKDDFRSAGLNAIAHDKWRIWADEWTPTWLPDAGGIPPASAVFAAGMKKGRRRRSADVAADPFWSATLQVNSYLSPGQQQAARAVMASTPGATIVVNLPTGSGKSAVAIVPAVLWSERTGVSVVVVPTTALALDQERALQGLFRRGGIRGEVPARFAYFGDQPAEEREEIRKRIRGGTQRVVFTSPESLMMSLAPSLSMAAEADLLKIFAVDETHIVSQWGDEFRPEFQAIAGMRLELLRQAERSGHDAFRTILMTGTLTEDAFQTLRSLFGRPGPVDTISAVTLRPEPSYWIAHCDRAAEREERLLEAVAHLPRPLIIYTTRVLDATHLHSLLRDRGYRRTALVTGGTGSSARLRVISELRGESFSERSRTGVDIVLATSAFGLGIDYSGIRAVVHACIPETADRFYQEVGRGGRDGDASISLVLHTDEDRRIAEGLNRKKIIGITRGRERWVQMLRGVSSEDRKGEDQVRVNLRSRPADLLLDSAENQAWNLRTISLMSRAGVLNLEAEPPPQRLLDESEEEWEKRRDEAFDLYYTTAVVRILRGDHADSAVWTSLIEPERRRTSHADRRSLELMYEALEGRRDFADIFSEAYAISADPESPQGVESVIPQKSCGGCPECRSMGRRPYEGTAPRPAPLSHPDARLQPNLERLFMRAHVLTVFTNTTDERRWLRECERVVRSCVRNGVRILNAPTSVQNRRDVQEAWKWSETQSVFVDTDYRPLELPVLPTLIVYPNALGMVAEKDHYRMTPGHPMRIIFTHESTRDFERRDHPLAGFRVPQIAVDEFLAVV